ncbi:MAG: hypothetical protein ACTTJC_08880 [Campylobacter sp.]
MRSGFNLVSTIFFIILISTIGVFSLSLSTMTAKQTGEIYLREQMQILAKSATETAVFELLTQKEAFRRNCPVGKIFTYNFPNDERPIVEILVVVAEVFGDFNGCGSKIYTKESYATVILDTFAKVINPFKTHSNSNNKGNFALNFHKRTIQKL